MLNGIKMYIILFSSAFIYRWCSNVTKQNKFYYIYLFLLLEFYFKIKIRMRRRKPIKTNYLSSIFCFVFEIPKYKWKIEFNCFCLLILSQNKMKFRVVCAEFAV